MSPLLRDSALLTAFAHVKENHGSAGVDGVTVEGFENNLRGNIAALANELRAGTYSPLPLLKLLVDKGNGEPRALCIPAVRDRVAQTAVLQVMEPILEKEFEECSFGYRKGRSVRQAVYRIKEHYNDGYRWVVDADIDAFFDNIEHDLLGNKVGAYVKDTYVRDLIAMWVKAEVWDGKTVSVMERGIPQGSPVSPILANLFLDELDEALLGKGQRIVRFADDFVVLCKSQDQACEALELTNDVLENLSLKLDESDIVSFDHGFKFLGVIFVKSLIMVPFDQPKKERKVLYYPPPLNMAAYLLKKQKGW